MADDKVDILGRWRVRFRQWTWEYVFTNDSVVRWKDPNNNENGIGRWALTAKTIYISWSKSTTTETWNRPVTRSDQSGYITASYGNGSFQAEKISDLDLPKFSGSSDEVVLELDPTTGEYVYRQIKPKDHARYIDRVVTAVGYSIYLGGYHVYVQGLELPILVPENMVDFSLGSVQDVSETIFGTREEALKAAAGDNPGQRQVAYFWGAGDAVVCPTVIGPATTPQLYSTIVSAIDQLVKEVQEELVMLAISLVGGMIARTILTRRISVKRGGNVPARKNLPNEPAVPAAPKIKPVNGQVSVGGGFENKVGSNLNPMKPGSGGPTKGIPNHVPGRMEDMADLFEARSVQKMISSRLRYHDVDWAKGTKAAAQVMAPNGKVAMNVWTQSAAEQEALKASFTAAGFKNVRVVRVGYDGSSTMVFADF